MGHCTLIYNWYNRLVEGETQQPNVSVVENQAPKCGTLDQHLTRGPRPKGQERRTTAPLHTPTHLASAQAGVCRDSKRPVWPQCSCVSRLKCAS
ncbi:hypothetical protein SKAU_G00327920 [Synaphobranchus kaupii]|uniref:Uncharacterized protein n=1 Tax=Synaphobranchus kaupii TaxID=118154 RepID=A0A9Q1EQ36_SYNKA|nr:hypothetical protein SKAU_G00327920 [Synaphobranchus kaupii]